MCTVINRLTCGKILGCVHGPESLPHFISLCDPADYLNVLLVLKCSYDRACRWADVELTLLIHCRITEIKSATCYSFAMLFFYVSSYAILKALIQIIILEYEHYGPLF